MLKHYFSKIDEPYEDIEFNKDSECLFIVYHTGAGGDMLTSIIDKHFINTGCVYKGITENGKIQICSSDHEATDVNLCNTGVVFDDKWFYDINENFYDLTSYSRLDYVIIACHLYREHQIDLILNTFPNAKVIKLVSANRIEESFNEFQLQYKLNNTISTIDLTNNNAYDLPYDHHRVLNIQWKDLWQEDTFENVYSNIIDFLNLEGKLIRWNFVEWYLSKQHPYFLKMLNQYKEIK